MCRIKLENVNHEHISLDFNDITEAADFMDWIENALNLEDIQFVDLEVEEPRCPCQAYMYN